MAAIDRDIARLAIPALGALVAEPLFLLTDTALVGHLGPAPLAGLGLASTVLQTAVGLLVVLAYATTPAVARLVGAGDRAGAVRAGIDGMWLAAIVGVVLLVGIPLSPAIVGAFGADGEVSAQATTYLAVSLAGIPAMLLVLAATGLLRGLQNTRIPLLVAVVGFAANAALNAVLIYPAGLGIAGSALGTVIAQWGMAIVYVVIAVRAARRDTVTLRPSLRALGRVATSGAWLFARTLALRVALVGTTVVATTLGTTALAATQIAMTLLFTLALVLDALAIAGQALVGHGLGAGDPPRVRAITKRLVLVGVAAGLGLGAIVAGSATVLPAVFTNDPGIRDALVPMLLVLAASIPLGGVVFVLDGVLIGAGDARYLALAGVINLAVYLPLLAAVAVTQAGATWLFAAFGFGYLGVRTVTLGLRARTDRWLR